MHNSTSKILTQEVEHRIRTDRLPIRDEGGRVIPSKRLDLQDVSKVRQSATRASLRSDYKLLWRAGGGSTLRYVDTRPAAEQGA